MSYFDSIYGPSLALLPLIWGSNERRFYIHQPFLSNVTQYIFFSVFCFHNYKCRQWREKKAFTFFLQCVHFSMHSPINLPYRTKANARTLSVCVSWIKFATTHFCISMATRKWVCVCAADKKCIHFR